MFIRPKSPTPRRPVKSVAYTAQTMEAQAEMLCNRLRKNFRRLAPTMMRKNIEAFRLYDWDIPEIRAVIDWYAGHAVLGEYVRTQTSGIPWLETMGLAVAQALEIPQERVHLRRRMTRPQNGERYQRLSLKETRLPVREGDLSFLVDLTSNLDTGLFTDHRITRQWIQAKAQNKRVLNLFAYTGSFSVYAAAGGASLVTSVDLSERYLNWARANFQLNGLEERRHQFAACEAGQFLREARSMRQKWDLIILDPPSFSSRPNHFDFDIQRDHRRLVEDTLDVLAPGGDLYFSTNHQRFVPELDSLRGAVIEEVTLASLPIDYKGRTPHRLFRLTKSN